MSNPGQFTLGINTILDRLSHNINCNIQDNTQFIEEWRRRLHILKQNEIASTIKFISKDSSGNLNDLSFIRKCNDILTKYANPSLSVTVSMNDISQQPNNVLADLDKQLGISFDVLIEALRKMTRLYIKTGEDLHDVDAALQEKLQRLDSAISCMNTLTLLDPSVDPSSLTGPIEDYLKHVFEKNSIETVYTQYIDTYKRFAALRSLINLMNVDKPTGPSCTICMTKEVTHAIAPCGHTFCDLCSAKQLTSCYICRAQIRDRLRIYY
jgi:hypothetical protein